MHLHQPNLHCRNVTAETETVFRDRSKKCDRKVESG